MGAINAFKSNLANVSDSSIVKLLSDVLLFNIDEITDFNVNTMYYKGDIVYIYDSTADKHYLYQCTQSIVPPGTFNSAQWAQYMFTFNTGLVSIENRYTAAADGASTCPIGIPSFDYTSDIISVFHSVRGRLFKGTDWNFDATGTQVVLAGFTLYQNESLLFEVLKN